jgi:hypothetical protein
MLRNFTLLIIFLQCLRPQVSLFFRVNICILTRIILLCGVYILSGYVPKDKLHILRDILSKNPVLQTTFYDYEFCNILNSVNIYTTLKFS